MTKITGWHYCLFNHLVSPFLTGTRLCSVSLLYSDIQKETRHEGAFSFMQKVTDNHQAEAASQLQQGQECWYLPIFCV